MADNPAVAVPQMNQETVLAQEALRDEAVQGHSDPSADHRHETRDADATRIAWIGAGMAAMGIGMFVGLWLLLNLFKRMPNTPDVPLSPLALNPPTPVAPRIPGVLGPNGAQESEGTTHIPIEQAKTALLRSGFATRRQEEPLPFPQAATVGGQDKPESLPLGMQPTGTYRADVGPTGKNP